MNTADAEAIIETIKTIVTASRRKNQRHALRVLTVDHVAQVLPLIGDGPDQYPLKTIARRTGISVSALYCYRDGKTSSGKDWPELRAALGIPKPITGSAKRQVRAVKSATTKQVLARSVTMWLDAFDRPHKTREEATAATRRGHAEEAVQALFKQHPSADIVASAIINNLDKLAEILRKV